MICSAFLVSFQDVPNMALRSYTVSTYHFLISIYNLGAVLVLVRQYVWDELLDLGIGH